MGKVDGVVDVYADVLASEVEIVAEAGKVTARQLIEVVNGTEDSEHRFKAKLKKGPEPVEEKP